MSFSLHCETAPRGHHVFYNGMPRCWFCGLRPTYSAGADLPVEVKAVAPAPEPEKAIAE